MSFDEGDLDRRLRAGAERYRVDPLFHAKIRMIADVFHARIAPELERLDIEALSEILLGMALQSIIAAEVFEELVPAGRLCGQQHHAIEGGSPCIARGSHETHVTASGRSWRS